MSLPHDSEVGSFTWGKKSLTRKLRLLREWMTNVRKGRESCQFALSLSPVGQQVPTYVQTISIGVFLQPYFVKCFVVCRVVVEKNVAMTEKRMNE